MKITITKRKIFIIITLTLLFVLSLAAGIYLLIKPNLFNKSYDVDKYPDTVDWCSTNLDLDTLNVDCKGLLLDIRNLEDGNSCFDVQILTKDKKLKDLTICEKKDSLTYTNELLGYKKLMPVDIIFSYTKERLLNNYSFSNVSLTKLDDTYVQNIVNEDIANLVTIDPASTTIQNSIDFCPNSDKLPNYVTETNKVAYTTFYNSNFMDYEKYTDEYLYNWDDSTIRIFFACNSAENMGYTDICDKTKINGLNFISSNNINHLNITPTWGQAMNDSDKALLKEISLIYDSMYLKTQQNSLTNLKLFNDLVNKINGKKEISEEVFCGIYPIYNALNKYNTQYGIDTKYILNSIEANYTKSNSSSCYEIIQNNEDIDKNGLFIRAQLFDNSTIHSACNNLKIFLLR